MLFFIHGPPVPSPQRPPPRPHIRAGDGQLHLLPHNRPQNGRVSLASRPRATPGKCRARRAGASRRPTGPPAGAPRRRGRPQATSLGRSRGVPPPAASSGFSPRRWGTATDARALAGSSRCGGAEYKFTDAGPEKSRPRKSRPPSNGGRRTGAAAAATADLRFIEGGE